MTSTVVLLSGGLDSAVILQRAVNRGVHVVALGLRYGQPHEDQEQAHAKAFCGSRGVEFIQQTLPGMPFPGVKGKGAIVPGRNLVLIAAGVSLAVARSMHRVAIGVNEDDRGIFPDCRPGFLKAACAVAEEGYGVQVLAPLSTVTKRMIRRLAGELGIKPEETWSCYTGGSEPCGDCQACFSLA